MNVKMVLNPDGQTDNNTSKQQTTMQNIVLNHGTMKLQQPGDDLDLKPPTGFQTKIPVKEYACKIKKKHQVVRDGVPYIKKPPNAFMLFMKQLRPAIDPELWKHGSGAVNQMLGKMWGTLTKEEKGVYFTEAEKLRVLHQRRYPGWNNKINYGKRRKRDRSPKMIRRPPPVPPKGTFVRTKTAAQPKMIFGNCRQMGPMQPCYTAAAYMQNYQPQEAYLQHPQQGYMRCPQQGPYMPFPQQGGYMPFPQQGPYMPFPAQGGNMQFPQQGGNMQFPQQGGYMQFPPQGCMQFPHLG
ncbi:transcription factor 7-like 1-B [Takifugu flavidus]|uniref:transcription factor 7-like 1-B n=1 Tax=Takifugu flavidus TaxID=433684 RepID=UPI002544797E|nr:transcription factor 7-like 1-B [Takifugu flavidus]